MKHLKLLACAAALTALVSCNDKSYEYPFQNPRLSVDKRVENLLSLLTPEEKVGLMMNGSISVDRLGIPAYNWWNEACHGICYDDATVFPQSVALAATFDADQQFEIYSAVSDEARAVWNTTDHNQFGVKEASGGIWHQGLSFWCPNVNIFRDPRWGRGQETSGEDPYLAGVMGTATVKGMQGNDSKYFKTVSCVKHYAVHSGPEPLRHKFDASVSMRDLWETYLPAFKAIVQEGNVQEVMCAYNRYEGVPCCGSERLLQNILREKWGYKAVVLSDCAAINNFYTKGQHETHPDAASASAAAVLAGTDLECGTSYKALIESLQKDLISEADLDIALTRVFRQRFELGTLDPAEMLPWKDLDASTLSNPAHTALATKAAREAMVLLKNNGILPLSKDIKTIAVVGPNADNVSMHNGNYNGIPTKSNTISIVDAIRKAAPGAEIIYDRACELVDPYLTTDHMADFNGGKGLHADFYNNQKFEGTPANSSDLTAVNLRTYGDYRFAENVNQTDMSARLTGKFTASFTGKMFYSLRGSDIYKFTVNGKVIAEQKEPVRGFGRRDSGTPTTTFPVVKGQTYNVQIDYVKGAEGFAFLSFDMSERNLATFDALVSKVKNADAIIMVGGLSSRLEGEEMPVSYEGFNGGDRTRIELPSVQKELLAAMRSTGKPIVLVNCSGSAIGFGEIESQYDALLQAWYAGQATGIAVADVLFGNYNPAGRLPVTFYASTDQLPDFENYDMEGHTYRYFRGEALYPFGFGLSYTTFSYGDATLSKSSVKAGNGVTISIPVTNSGKMAGDEVVQVYIKSLDNPEAPIKSLKGFKRVNIAAGATATVTIDLTSGAFEYYNEKVDELSPRAGKYQILYGSSSRESDLKAIDFQVI